MLTATSLLSFQTLTARLGRQTRTVRKTRANGRMPRLPGHDLRHAFATLALADGGSIWDVSDMLGHSSKALTVATYAHSMEPTGGGAVSNLARTLLRAEVA